MRNPDGFPIPGVITVTSSRTGTVAEGLSGRRGWVACGLVLAAVLAATVPTVGDFGVTWDEPAYRYSQMRAAQWWEDLAKVRGQAELRALVEPDALLFYWTYGRYGINFHPPLAGQLNLLTYKIFGSWMRDTPARRMASVLEYALTITMLFGFLSRRYGVAVGLIAAGALLTMPRVYGDGHLAVTDAPGLFLWAATALAFWKGLHEPNAGRWRVLVGVLIGLGFIEKMAAVFVLGPLLLWLGVARLPRTFRRSGWSDWVDGIVTSAALLAPLAIAFDEILRLSHALPRPKYTDLFVNHPVSHLPGIILAVPLAVWMGRRVLARVLPKGPVWGVERPGLEIWEAIIAFPPLIGWLGNPAWWRETLPRLAHYYMLNTERRGALPDIQIAYLGATFEFSLPWHNGWVLIAVTVPATILLAALVGIVAALARTRRDALPWYFLVNLVALPMVRMLPTPAHDGVRLMLPTFFFLAAFAGWGGVAAADTLGTIFHARRIWTPRVVMAALILGPSTYGLVRVHPFELSYFNELIGGPRGAWKRGGFELSYWYDAFNGSTLAQVNRRLPAGAQVDFLNDSTRTNTFQELQSLGDLRPDIRLGWYDPHNFPYVWLLTQDSKAKPFTRILFEMKPFLAITPRQLDGLRVATVADPAAVSRAYALGLLLNAADKPAGEIAPQAPRWVEKYAPFLGRFWGVGLTKLPRPPVNEAMFDWARRDPDGLLAAAQVLVKNRGVGDNAEALRLYREFSRVEQYPYFYAQNLLRIRPEAIVESIRILITRTDDVHAVLTRDLYTDPNDIGGYLDRDLPADDSPRQPERQPGDRRASEERR